MFSAPPKDPTNPDSDGVDPADLQHYLMRQLRFTAGTETCYRTSIICGVSTWQHFAAGLPIGKRFHSAPVIRLADARPLQIGHVANADGRWRLYVFAPAEDPGTPSSRLRALCTFLTDLSQSPIRRFTPPAADIDAVIDVRAIFQQNHRDLDLAAMPSLLLPRKGRYGLHDYEKMFCSDRKSGRTSSIFGASTAIRGVSLLSGPISMSPTYFRSTPTMRSPASSTASCSCQASTTVAHYTGAFDEPARRWLDAVVSSVTKRARSGFWRWARGASAR